MPERLVLYTAIFGRYDQYFEPPDGDYETVLFTDTPPAKTRRAKVVHVALEGKDPRRLARLHKTNSHLLFPDADLTIWMDGLIIVKEVEPRAFIQEHLADADLACHHNVECQSVSAALEICANRGRDDLRVMRAQVERYKVEGFPDTFGLVETGVVLRRNTPGVAAFNEIWRNEIAKGSVRDQLSFNYAAWKSGVRFAYIPGSLSRDGSPANGFHVFKHSR